MIVVSIIGTDRFNAGYGAAKIAHEQAHLSGPIPARVLRAAQFHEFVAQLVECGTRGQVAYAPRMRTQLVAARAVARYSPTWPPHRKTAAFAADVAGLPLAAAAGLGAAARIASVALSHHWQRRHHDQARQQAQVLFPSPSPAPGKRW